MRGRTGVGRPIAFNALFKRSQEQVGYRIVDQAATHARQIGQAVELHGQTRVEQVLDAALSLEAHIDTVQLLRRDRYPEFTEATRSGESSDPVQNAIDLTGCCDQIVTDCDHGEPVGESRTPASCLCLPAVLGDRVRVRDSA